MSEETIAAEANPPAKPDGAPDLWPFQGLPRRKKAEFFRRLDVVEDAGGLSPEGREDGTLALSEAANLYETLAEVEDLLAVAAIDEDAYRAWVSSASDADLMGLMAWYFAVFQPGEAGASPS